MIIIALFLKISDIEVVPAKHAQEIMQQLTDKGIQFSAVSRQHDKAAITVHSDYKDELQNTAQSIATEKLKKNNLKSPKTIKKKLYLNLKN